MRHHRLLTALAVTVAAVAAACAPPPAPPSPLAPPTIPTPTLPKTTTTTTTTSTTTTTLPPTAPSCVTPAAAAAATHRAVLDVDELDVATAAAQTAAAVDAAAAGTPVGVVVVADGQPRVEVVDAASATDVVADVLADPDVDLVAVEAAQQMEIAGAAPVNDTWRNLQWGFDAVAFEDAWACSTGSGVDIAVVDTGVDATHPEFAGRISAGAAYLGGGELQPGEGGVDPNGHGTHVAGIAAAAANNGAGVAGVAPDARIIPVRVLDANGKGWDIDVARGIIWAVDNGAEVINLSLAGEVRSAAITSAVEYAIAAGVVVVAAAGNDGPTGPTAWPGAEDGVVAVAASTSSGKIATFSTHGGYVDLTAPGDYILSTVPGGYGYSSGTSMAAPHVAGVAALVISARPDVTAAQVSDLLNGTAVDMGPTGWDPAWGAGLVDPVAAITG